MVIIQNGDIVEVNPAGIRTAGKVPSGVALVDSSRVSVVGRDILKDRQQLAEDGVITVAITLGADGKLATDPTIQLRGVAHSINLSRFQQAAKQVVGNVLTAQGSELILNNRSGQSTIDWDGLKTIMDRELRRLIRREFDRRDPMLIVLFQGVTLSSVPMEIIPVPAVSAS
jgi:ribonuclease J